MFSLLSSWNPWNLFFAPPPPGEPKEDNPYYQVLQQTEHGGLTSTECILTADVVGRYYLNPVNKQERIPDRLPSSEGWPASAETEATYLAAISAFQGIHTTRPSSYISELLSDLALNIPHERVTVVDPCGNRYSVPGQVISDIRRRSEFYINDTLIFRAHPLYPKPKADRSDEDNAKATFETCVQKLGNDITLARNALKLTTQATVAHQCVIMYCYFTNMPLMWRLSCGNQVVNITYNPNLTTITYESLWHLINFNDNPAPPKFLKADVHIIIPTESLRIGTSAGALLHERVSPFYSKEIVAQQADLNKAGWPALAATRENYQQMLITAPAMEESIPPWMLRKVVEAGLTLVCRNSLDHFSSFNKLLTFTVDNNNVLSITSAISLETRAALLLENLCMLKLKSSYSPHQLATLASRSLYEFLFSHYRERFERVDLSHILQSMNYKIFFEFRTATVIITIDSLWQVVDTSSFHTRTASYFSSRLSITLSDPQDDHHPDFSGTLHTSPIQNDYTRANHYSFAISCNSSSS